MSSVAPDLRPEVLAVLHWGLERVGTHWQRGRADGSGVDWRHDCALTALCSSGENVPIDEVAKQTLCEHLPLQFQPDRLVAFNAAQRTNAPVVALYERAIAALDSWEASDG